MKLEDFGLRQDPFPIVPDGPVHNWAGRTELREDLVDLVKGVRARDVGVTEFVVLYGELGAGKSHALRFLETLIEEDAANFNSLAIYLERPRVASKLNFIELHKYIIKEIGREKIRALCNAVKEQVDLAIDEQAKKAGLGHVQDKKSFLEPAMDRFHANDRDMIHLLWRGAASGSKIFEFLIGAEKCDGSEYEGKIDSDFIAAKVLSDFFRVLTSELMPDVRVKESIYLFIDEGEMLFESKSSESDLVFNGLRELINGLPYRFGLLISFSAATALIEAVMPQHLLKRLTRPYVEVPMLDDLDAVEFLRQQLNFSRIDGSPFQGSFYPFSEEAITFIIENTTTLTPRNLFIDCKRVLERAIRRFELEPGQEITRELAERILGGYR